MRMRLTGIGAWGPGFRDWRDLSAQLSGKRTDPMDGPVAPAPSCMAPRERRRAPQSVKLAVEVAQQACEAAGQDPSALVCVFGSGMGDMDITDYMCRELAREEPMVSPTKFHNSVHNAPVGYWSISQGCRESTNAVSAHEHTVPVSLLEALVQGSVERVPVLWVSQDLGAPGPFQALTRSRDACAFALLLAPPEAGAPGPVLEAALIAGNGTWPGFAAGGADALEYLYGGNPSARLLPLLHALAAGAAGAVRLPLNENLDLQLVVS